MATAEKIDEVLRESVRDGFVQFTLIQVYEVVTTDRDAQPSEAKNAAGIPPRGQQYALAGETNVFVWCVDREARRREVNKTGRVWRVTCTFTNYTQDFERDANGNPVENPADAVKRVDIAYLEYQAKLTDATLKRFTVGGPDWSDSAQTRDNPTWLSNRTSEPGPVVMSNTVPVEYETTKYQEVITVTQVFDEWQSTWDEYKGALNTDSITIEQSDSTGVKWSKTYAPYTLRMRPIYKGDIWKDQILYFRRVVAMEYNENTWIISQPDISTKRYIKVGQVRAGLLAGEDDYTQEDLDDLGINGDYGTTEIVTFSENPEGGEPIPVAIGDPVLFNGTGMDQPTGRDVSGSYNPGQVFFGNWYPTENLRAFGPLNL